MNAKSTQQLEHRWRWQFALGNRIHRHFCSALVAIFEALHKQALNSSLPICNLSSARFTAIFLCRIHEMMPGGGSGRLQGSPELIPEAGSAPDFDIV
jgi:hypothetical protein